MTHLFDICGLGNWFFCIWYYTYLSPQLQVFSLQIVISILLIKLLSNLTHKKGEQKSKEKLGRAPSMEHKFRASTTLWPKSLYMAQKGRKGGLRHLANQQPRECLSPAGLPCGNPVSLQIFYGLWFARPVKRSFDFSLLSIIIKMWAYCHQVHDGEQATASRQINLVSHRHDEQHQT